MADKKKKGRVLASGVIDEFDLEDGYLMYVDERDERTDEAFGRGVEQAFLEVQEKKRLEKITRKEEGA